MLARTKSECASGSFGPELLNSRPLGGTHHCIATGHAIVNAVFRHLRTECASYGGHLTVSDLASLQAELIEDLVCVFSLFEGIHRRCMEASDAAAPMMFAKGRMLSSLLLACSHKAAARAFPDEIHEWGANWLHLFYDALSESALRHANLNAEARLTSAYVKASCKLGQRLSVRTLLLEPTVQNVLRECALAFEKPGRPDAELASLRDEINGYIDARSEDCPHSGGIGTNQIRKFLILFPHEVGSSLTDAAPDERELSRERDAAGAEAAHLALS